MAENRACQRPECSQPGKLRTIVNPENGGKVKIRLCDGDYKAARAKEPPLWLHELLTHVGLVG